MARFRTIRGGYRTMAREASDKVLGKTQSDAETQMQDARSHLVLLANCFEIFGINERPSPPWLAAVE